MKQGRRASPERCGSLGTVFSSSLRNDPTERAAQEHGAAPADSTVTARCNGGDPSACWLACWTLRA